jgi:hypothetical protein
VDQPGRLGRLGGWIGFLFAAASAIVAYTEYRNNQQQNKIERTLNYYNYFQDTQAHQASFDLVQLWDTESPALDAALTAAPKGQAAKIYDDFVVDLVQKHNARAKVLLMIGFYNSLATCVTADLCDRLTALRFYGPEAKTFRNNYFAYVEAYKKQNAEIDLTRPLERFVADYKSLRQVDLSRADIGTCRYLPDAFAGIADGLSIPC